jgi:hypothetical protein
MPVNPFWGVSTRLVVELPPTFNDIVVAPREPVTSTTEIAAVIELVRLGVMEVSVAKTRKL